jgi:site-specific recombinase XerD
VSEGTLSGTSEAPEVLGPGSIEADRDEDRHAMVTIAQPPISGDASGAATDGRLIELWLHGKSEATRQAYRSDLSKFLDFTDGKPLRVVTLSDVQEFTDFISELLAPASQARILAALKSLFAFGHQVGYLPFDVGRPVKLPARRDDRAERILSADDVHSMIAHAKKGRDRALIRVLYIGGLRVAEAVGLRTRDLVTRDDGNKGRGQLAVFGKGSKSRPVLVPHSLFEELSALSLPNPDAPLFRSQKKGPDGGPRAITARQAERIVKQAARKAGIKNASEVSPHWLRHAHASHAMDRGAKIHLVQATLGHSDISTTGRYLHARPDESSALYLGS